ncbi:MAG: hypothetical protein E7354_02310 [Clostridiales bacterium]|nr:hypothetical protein [Clostridiales bacterium]
MNINIVSGKCSENNNKQIFSLLKNRDKSKRHIILAPDRCLFSIEKRLFEELDESCFFDISVSSMTALSKNILDKKNNKKLLTKNSGIALVRKLLNKHKDSLLSFKKATSFMGFARTIFETICLYKSCNITPEEVYTDDSVNYSNLKQKDIKLIYSAYEEYLQKDYTDSFNQLMLFASLIKKDTFKDTIFYIVEFDDFTSIMYNIIYKLSKFSDAIYVTCTYGKNNNNSNIYSNKVYYDLIELYKSNGLQFNIITANQFDDDTHNVILNNLLTYNQVTPTHSEDIDIYAFDNIDDEVKFAIAKIYELAILKKVDFSHFAIVVPSISEYSTRLIREMGKYDIPYYIDENKVLSDHILVRNYLDIWSIVLSDYNVTDFINLIKSPVLSFDNEKVASYDQYLKIISAGSHNAIIKDMLDGDLLDFCNMITDIQREIKDNTDTSSFVEVSKKIFEYILTRGESYLGTLDDLEKRVYSQVVTKFNNILCDYYSVFGETEQDATEYIETSSVYFENTNISLPPINSNTIFIAADSSYFSPVDYLFILGSNETKQPIYKLDNGLITDEEIVRLPNAKKINPTISAINNRKTFKLFEYFMKFKSKLVLSYPQSSADSVLYPSTMLLSLQALFDKEPVNGSYILDIINNSAEMLDRENIIFNNLTERVLVDNILKLRKQWYTYEDKRGFREMLSSLYKVNSNTLLNQVFNNNELLSDTRLNGKHNLFRNNTTSISQIECYYNCPYKHFVRYGLKLRDAVKVRLMPNDIGTIFHLVFKDLLPYIVAHIDENDIYDMAQKQAVIMIKTILKKEEYVDILKNPENQIIMKSIYSEMARVVDAIVYELQVSNYRPKFYEYSFNTNDCVEEGITFTGSIDRVDVLSDKFVIIDYKTGSNDFSDYSDVYSGNKLQLLAYAKFFQNKTNLRPAGVFYLPVSNKFNATSNYKFNGVTLKEKANIVDIDTSLAMPDVTSKVLHLDTKVDGEISSSAYYKKLCLTREELDYLLDYSVMQVRKAIANISANDISIKPLNSTKGLACNKCNYKGLCNYLDNNERKTDKIETIEELKSKEAEDGEV